MAEYLISLRQNDSFKLEEPRTDAGAGLFPVAQLTALSTRRDAGRESHPRGRAGQCRAARRCSVQEQLLPEQR